MKREKFTKEQLEEITKKNLGNWKAVLEDHGFIWDQDTFSHYKGQSHSENGISKIWLGRMLPDSVRVYGKYRIPFKERTIPRSIKFFEDLDRKKKELFDQGIDTNYIFEKVIRTFNVATISCYLRNTYSVNSPQQFEDLVKAFGGLVE